jgi:hypothetical protein
METKAESSRLKDHEIADMLKQVQNDKKAGHPELVSGSAKD